MEGGKERNQIVVYMSLYFFSSHADIDITVSTVTKENKTYQTLFFPKSVHIEQVFKNIFTVGMTSRELTLLSNVIDPNQERPSSSTVGWDDLHRRSSSGAFGGINNATARQGGNLIKIHALQDGPHGAQCLYPGLGRFSRFVLLL